MQNLSSKEVALAVIGAVLAAGEEGKVYNPQVDRTGDKIILPENANLPEVIEALQRTHQSEQKRIVITANWACAPWDGAIALKKAIEENIGVFIHNSPYNIDVDVDLGKSVAVPWGEFALPVMEDATATTEFNWNPNDGMWQFSAKINVKRKYEARVRRVLDLARELAFKEPLHKNKAFILTFKDPQGERVRMPVPRFFAIQPDEPIFRQELTNTIDRNIIAPIVHHNLLAMMGEPLKRGALFAGPYGTGKTMLASYIAKRAIEAGWTFIYVKDSSELPEALRYAQQYEPCVVFAEDVDRIAGEKRDNAVNSLLNQLDGIDSKASRIFTILTSNHADQINPAMRRPGRIDMIMEVLPPDADAAARMIRFYGKDSIDPSTDLTAAGKVLEGEIPARIREVVSRSKLEGLRRTGRWGEGITGEDVEAVAKEVKAEANLFVKKVEADMSGAEAIAQGFSQAAVAAKKVAAGIKPNGHAVTQ